MEIILRPEELFSINEIFGVDRIEDPAEEQTVIVCRSCGMTVFTDMIEEREICPFCGQSVLHRPLSLALSVE